ncbi:hypothetical protein H0H87_005091 [Tephrocybe sp. NHM501043]|nr:hypothetical protein H0H87_005091 [Tephrocybe sp. NHM501043]
MACCGMLLHQNLELAKKKGPEPESSADKTLADNTGQGIGLLNLDQGIKPEINFNFEDEEAVLLEIAHDAPSGNPFNNVDQDSSSGLPYF